MRRGSWPKSCRWCSATAERCQELMEIAASKSAEPPRHRSAMRVLVEARAAGLSSLLLTMIDERDVGADTARGLAAFDDPNIPAALIKRLPNLKEPARDAAIVSLSSRPAWARVLLAAMAGGTLDRSLVPTFQIRQMAAFPDEEVRRQVASLWPDLRPIADGKQQRMDELGKSLGAVSWRRPTSPTVASDSCRPRDVPHAIWRRREDRPRPHRRTANEPGLSVGEHRRAVGHGESGLSHVDASCSATAAY